MALADVPATAYSTGRIVSQNGFETIGLRAAVAETKASPTTRLQLIPKFPKGPGRRSFRHSQLWGAVADRLETSGCIQLNCVGLDDVYHRHEIQFKMKKSELLTARLSSLQVHWRFSDLARNVAVTRRNEQPPLRAYVPEFTAFRLPQIVAHKQYHAVLDPFCCSIDHVAQLPCASHLAHLFCWVCATRVGHEATSLGYSRPWR